jgi:hypothetical protein
LWLLAIIIPGRVSIHETAVVVLNGILKGILINVPQLVGTTTATLDILDADGYTVYSKASLAENQRTTAYVDANNHPLNLPLAGKYTVKVTASNAQTGQAADIPVVLLIDRG